MIATFNRNRFKILHVLLLILITVVFRLPTFLLSHNNNDELIHLSLAKKIESYGASVFEKQEYNLLYIDKVFDPENKLIGIFEGERKIGSLLQGFLGERSQVSHHPPLIPAFIAISHKIFSNNYVYLVNVSKDFYLMLRNAPIQFYACIVQFLFSLLLILSVYFLGCLFFSHKIGWLSAFFLSLTPIELLTANKIWADDMTAFFAVLAVILHLYSLKSDKPLLSLFAGVSCGLAIITKMSAVYIIFTVSLFHLFEHRKDEVNVRNISSFLFDRKILYFLAGAFITSAWWFNLYYSYFNLRTVGMYLKVNEPSHVLKNWNRYFSFVSLRPWYSYFVLVPFQFPLYILSYIFIPLFTFRNKIKSFGELIGKEYRYLQFLIIWIVLTFIFLSLKPGKELRYMLIAFPAIATLSAYCLNLFYEWLNNENSGLSIGLVRLFIISIIFVSLAYSLKIALPKVLFRADFIPIPL
ncbi:phospholipid carrier-dependent glycosyltransferase [Candidatus Omnitrophota bacterium]